MSPTIAAAAPSSEAEPVFSLWDTPPALHSLFETEMMQVQIPGLNNPKQHQMVGAQVGADGEKYEEWRVQVKIYKLVDPYGDLGLEMLALTNTYLLPVLLSIETYSFHSLPAHHCLFNLCK